ncbi:MAG TPA: carbohydrate-binding domain-containing protein [Clostridiaceae bacterium]|nr:carbohydrate-binding domain-containing protein [Clostridiaceae bacterium]
MKRSIFILLMACMLLASGCSYGNRADNKQKNSTDTKTSDNNSSIDSSKLFSSRDFEAGYDESTSTIIQLNSDTATSTSSAVKISGSTVTITDEGTYILAGTLNDGIIIVDSEKTDKVQLVLNNVSINSETSAPIYIRQSDKVFITLAQDSVNTLTNGGTFTAIDENNIDAAIFSKEDLTLNGSGILTITSPAGHGIVSKDELTLTGGTYYIISASHGLEGKDNICIANAEINITSGKDGIHAENAEDTSLGFIYIQSGTFNIFSDGDGIAASDRMQIDDGTFYIISGSGSWNPEKKGSDFRGSFLEDGGRQGKGFKGGNTANSTKSTDTKDNSTSCKGIRATGNLIINGGSFTVDTADDAVHSNASITISGGTFQIAANDDGFHADETLAISSGTINIAECYEGLEGFHVKISGGDITIYASDDGINAAGGTDQSGIGGIRGKDKFGGRRGGGSSSNGSIAISGGKLYINAGGDGIDANGTLMISGGYAVVCSPTDGDTATLDYDVSGTITGGTFIGTGASSMAKSFSDSEQGVIAVRVGKQPAGTAITLTDSDGNTVISSYAPELDFAVVILSSPDIVKGKTYTLTVGSYSEEFTAS